MSNKRITDLTELTTPTTDDVFPVVDIATNTTTKVQLGNLPVPSSVTTALATKQNTLVSGTNIKTVNSNSLLGAGDVAVQETLVSGTNIKTLNSVSLLGAGNIVLTANPSGVAGAIQFSNGSAFASDATNLFWDDTNNRLGVGTNAPTQALDVVGQSRFSDNILFSADFKYIGRDLNASSIRFSSLGNEVMANISTGGRFAVNFPGAIRFQVSAGGQTTILGGGSTSATTSLLVQNSAGTEIASFRDDLMVSVRSQFRVLDAAGNNAMIMYGDGISGTKTLWVNGSLGVGALGNNASARLQVDSTTQGFLPPRMTTTQRNAIASPAAGLVVYDSTTNKLQCYNGSTWNDLF